MGLLICKISNLILCVIKEKTLAEQSIHMENSQFLYHSRSNISMKWLRLFHGQVVLGKQNPVHLESYLCNEIKLTNNISSKAWQIWHIISISNSSQVIAKRTAKEFLRVKRMGKEKTWTEDAYRSGNNRNLIETMRFYFTPIILAKINRKVRIWRNENPHILPLEWKMAQPHSRAMSAKVEGVCAKKKDPRNDIYFGKKFSHMCTRRYTWKCPLHIMWHSKTKSIHIKNWQV